MQCSYLSLPRVLYCTVHTDSELSARDLRVLKKKSHVMRTAHVIC
jgi:hypothetical protein